MKIEQRVYLSVVSESVSAAEVTAVVGLEPDRVAVRGSRDASTSYGSRPSPPNHVWSISERLPGVQIDVQVTTLLDRVRPHLDGLRAVAAQPDVHVSLLMGRSFNDEDGQEDIEGWALGPDVLALLASIPAGLDVDEYTLGPTIAQALRALPQEIRTTWWLARSRWRRARAAAQTR